MTLVTKPKKDTGPVEGEYMTYETVQKAPRIFLGLQGTSGEGKTTAALTFPRPTLLSFDDNLPSAETLAEIGVRLEDIKVVPIHSTEWCRTIGKDTFKVDETRLGGKKMGPNRRDIFTSWLDLRGSAMTAEETLIIDSWTELQACFDRQQDLEPIFSRTGSIDTMAWWGAKLKWSKSTMERIKGLSCNVVITFHENQMRDPKTNMLMDKIGPLQQGQFAGQIMKYFADYYRALSLPRKDQQGKVVKTPDGKGQVMDFWWQVKPDAMFAARSRLSTKDAHVPAGYQSLVKYKLVRGGEG